MSSPSISQPESSTWRSASPFPEFLFSWVVAAGLPAASASSPCRPLVRRLLPMSWAAHDLEPYVIQKHMGKKVAFVPLLIGSYSPDILSKWFVYGFDAFSAIHLQAGDPVRFPPRLARGRLHALADVRRPDRRGAHLP